MYEIEFTNKFLKAYKRCIKRNQNIELIDEAIKLLIDTGKLPLIYKPHPLSGDLKGFMECHIQPDWLLVWEIDKLKKVIRLVDTGSHSDLFR
jgi:mRNA interferase YafQ